LNNYLAEYYSTRISVTNYKFMKVIKHCIKIKVE